MSIKRRKKKYVEYNYDDTFIDPLELANERKIEDLLAKGYIHSVYATKTIKAGNQFEIEIYPQFTRKEYKELKLKKTNKAQRSLNDRYARKRVERLINNNFKAGDLYLTFTYDNEHLPDSIEKAQNDMKNFIRRINYKRAKEGLDKAKYIYVTEYSNKEKIRCHHHLIMDCGIPGEIVENMWKCGRRNNIRKCDPDKDGLTGLAKYLVKDPKGNKRWCSSLNLKKPKESKSYYNFKASHVKKIVQRRASVKHMVESKYKNYIYTSEEIKYNEINGKFYVYVRMRERRNL